MGITYSEVWKFVKHVLHRQQVTDSCSIRLRDVLGVRKMATIALHAHRVKQMPGLVRDVKKSVWDYKVELSLLEDVALRVDQTRQQEMEDWRMQSGMNGRQYERH